MDYNQIKEVALSYSDREDEEVISNMDNFLKVVEARINRELETRQSHNRAVMTTVEGQQYYGLPADFNGMRDIQVDGTTLQYRSPELMNQQIAIAGSTPIYTIIANQIQIYPTPGACQLEVVYSQSLPPLTDTASENWVTRAAPDVYLWGLLVEISAFTKDGQAGQIWDSRFLTELDKITQRDKTDRWSGVALQIKLG